MRGLVDQAVRQLPSTSTALRGHLDKYESFFARIALISHLVEYAVDRQPPGPVISGTTGQRVATLLLDYLLPHASHVFTTLTAPADVNLVRRLAAQIVTRKLTKVTFFEAGRLVRPLRNNNVMKAQVLDQLTAFGWLTPSETNRTQSWSQTWFVKPAVHELFASLAEQEMHRLADEQAGLRHAFETLNIDGSTEVDP